MIANSKIKMNTKVNRNNHSRKSIKRTLSYIYMTGDSSNWNFAFVKFTSQSVEIFYKMNDQNKELDQLLELSYDTEINEYSKYEKIIRESSGAILKYNYKQAFIPSYTYGNDSKNKQKHNQKTIKLGNKKLIYTVIDKSSPQITSMLGEFIVIQLEKHHYLALSYGGIHEFNTLDDIVYCSQGASTRSGSQIPFIIGTNNTYLIMEYESKYQPHFYVSNDIMKELNVIDPNELVINKNGEILTIKKGLMFDKKYKTGHKINILKILSKISFV